MTGTTGLYIVILVNAIPNCSAAGFINAQCEGTLTGNNMARLAPLSFASTVARLTASISPAITTWPGELKLTASTTAFLAASIHVSLPDRHLDLE